MVEGWLIASSTPEYERMLRIVCLSDTHNRHRDALIPEGDILIHAGDITQFGEEDILRDFNQFMADLPHKHKVIIAGNHDFYFQKFPEESRTIMTNCIYLQDEEVVIEGLRIYGSPWQPWFYDWAFNLRRGDEIRERWLMIPPGIDILVTHGPPQGEGDLNRRGELIGCEDLLDVVKIIRPKYHVFGHNHSGYGLSKSKHTTFINACLNSGSRVLNKPIVIDVNSPEH